MARRRAGLLGDEPDRCRDLGLAGRSRRRRAGARGGRSCRRADGLGAGAVRDRAAGPRGIPAHDPALAERILRVRRELGLDADDPGVRAQGANRDRDAAREPAAADRDEHGGEIRHVLRDLQPDRALAGDDPVVVVGRDRARGRRSAASRSAIASRSPLAVPTVMISAPSASTRARLIAGASAGMTIDGVDAEHPSRPGHALGVIARRVGDDPRACSASVNDEIAWYAPRILKAPTGCKDSAFRRTRGEPLPN